MKFALTSSRIRPQIDFLVFGVKNIKKGVFSALKTTVNLF